MGCLIREHGVKGIFDRRKGKDTAQRGKKHEVQEEVAIGSLWKSGRRWNRRLCLGYGTCAKD